MLINKIDLTNQEDLVKLVEAWHEQLPQAEIIPISATSKFNVDNEAFQIPENEAYACIEKHEMIQAEALEREMEAFHTYSGFTEDSLVTEPFTIFPSRSPTPFIPLVA